ncbi:MAG: hypothetical protein AAF480_16350 [Actinomycetota bacterium]
MSDGVGKRVVRSMVGLMVGVAVLAGCGGDDDTSAGPAPATGDEASTDGGDGSAADADATSGPVDGALVSVLTFDFGLWALDPTGGDPFEVVVPDAGFSDRQVPPFVTPDGSTAVVLVFTTVEGQTFSNDVGLGGVDLATAEGRLIAPLGQDRPDDESTDSTSWEILAVSDSTAWVTESTVGGNEALLAVDLVAGTVSTAVEASEVRVRSAAVVGDVLYGQFNGAIHTLGATGWDEVVAIDALAHDRFLSPATMAEFAITRSGAPLDPEWASSMLTFFDVRPTIAGIVGSGDLLYWQFNENWSNADGTDSAIVGGIVQFDTASAQITGIWPLGDSVGSFPGENEISTSSQGTWHVTGDLVWFADQRDDGDLLRFDPSTGVEAFDIVPLDGADYTRIELLANDPDGVWLILEDWTVSSSDESGTSASGETRFVLVDPSSGALTLEIDESDLIGF